MKCPYCGAEAKGKFCEYCGSEVPREKAEEPTVIINNYYYEKPASSYQYTDSRANTGKKSKRKKRTWLWVLGWICMFPVPLTILLLRKKEMKPALKYGIIATVWIVYLLIGLFGENEDTNSMTNDTTTSIIEEAPWEVETNKIANRYYYGELGSVLLSDDDSGCELMVKRD